MTALFNIPKDFSPEKLMNGIAVSIAERTTDLAEKRLVHACKCLAEAKAENPPRPHHIQMWEYRAADMEAALETYQRRLGAAKVAAGWVN